MATLASRHPLPREVDPTTRARLQDAVRALDEEAEASRAELESAIAQNEPRCPLHIFGPDEPVMSERHHRAGRDRSRQERDDRDDR